MRKKLSLGVIALALAVPAPAFAIHDPNVPAGQCPTGNGAATAVGIPSNTAGQVSQHRDLSFSNDVLSDHNRGRGANHCHFE